ncbi:MAG: hypothetical protein AMXMBFR64_33440 [Myxococcales bacterium]
MELLQVRYGKLVQSPRGPIVPGCDHGCTVRSPGVTAEVVRWCRPDRLGLGGGAGFTWDHYRWPDGGVVGAAVEGVVVVGRIRGRSEAGEGAPGRLYTEAHYGVCRPDAWDRALLPAVPLSPEPPVVVDPAAPPLVVSPTDIALPDGWAEQVRLLLAVVASGLAVGIRDRGAVEAQLERTAVVLACLPREVAWRVPFGAGLARVTDAVAIGFGEAVATGVSIVDGVLRGADEAALPGLAYAEHVARIGAGATTLRELCERVDAALGGLRLSPGDPWPVAARRAAELAQDLDHIDGLRRSLHCGAAARVEVTMLHLDALHAVATAPRGQRAAALAGTRGPEWAEAWRRAAETSRSVRALGVLLGTVQVHAGAAPELLDDVRSEHLDAAEEAAQRVARLLDRVPPGQVEGLAAPAAGDAEWVRRWRELAQGRLAWAALRSQHGRRSDRAWAAELDTGAWRAARALTHGEPAAEDLVELARCFAPEDEETVTRLLDLGVSRGSLTGAWRLAEAVGLGALAARLPERHGARAAVALARSVAGPVSATMIDALLRDWHTVERELDVWDLRARVAAEVGDPWARLLLRERASRGAPASDVGRKWTLERAKADRGVARDLLAAADGGRELLLCARDWARQVDPASVVGDPGLSYLVACLRGAALPRLDMDDARGILAPLLALRGSAAHTASDLFRAASTEAHVWLALKLWGEADPPPLDVVPLAVLLTSTDPAWRARASRWPKAEGWRLVAGEHAGEVDAIERAALGRVAPAALVRLLLAMPRLQVDADLLDRIDARDLSVRGEAGLTTLLEHAHAAGSRRLARHLLRPALRALLDQGVSMEKVRRAAERGAFRRFLLRAVSGGSDRLFDLVAATVRDDPGALRPGVTDGDGA